MVSSNDILLGFGAGLALGLALVTYTHHYTRFGFGGSSNKVTPSTKPATNSGPTQENIGKVPPPQPTPSSISSQAPPGMSHQCAATLLRSSISSVNQDGGKLTHCYYQENDGSISVIYKNGPISSDASWGGGDGVTVLAAGNAVMHTPLATIHWQLNGRDEYRTYYLSPSFQICENVLSQPNDGGRWHPGGLQSSSFVAAPYSKLSAIIWTTGGSPHIRVYYQGLDDKIHEICYEGSWTSGATLPGTPLHGSSLAFVQRSSGSTPSIRGYYQESNRTLNEVCWDSGWSLGTHIGQQPLPYRTAIAATVPPGKEDQWIRVYYLTDGFKIAEFWWSAGWHGPATLPFPDNDCVPDAQLAAVSFFRDDGFDAQPDVRIYVQRPFCIWREVACTRGTWTGSDGLKNVGIKMIPIS